MTQISHIPSIDLVQIAKGRASVVKIDHYLKENDAISPRAVGFANLLAAFQDKVRFALAPLPTRGNQNISFQTWTCRSTRKQRVGSLSLGNTSNIRTSQIRTRRVRMRVVATRHALTHGIEFTVGIDAMLDDFTLDWEGRGSVGEAFRHTCPPQTQARRLYSTLPSEISQYRRPKNYFNVSQQSRRLPKAFQFVEGVDYDYDFCDSTNAMSQHGHFFSDWRTIPALYPVFSPGKAPGYSDIVIPSHYYYTSTKRCVQAISHILFV